MGFKQKVRGRVLQKQDVLPTPHPSGTPDSEDAAQPLCQAEMLGYRLFLSALLHSLALRGHGFPQNPRSLCLTPQGVSDPCLRVSDFQTLTLPYNSPSLRETTDQAES